MNEVYIVRHGETDWNVLGQWQGNTDIPLNENGLRDAYTLKEKLSHISFDLCFSSHLQRASKTASILVEGKEIDVTLVRDFQEMGFGPLEGKRKEDFPLETQESLKKVYFNKTKDDYFHYQFHPEVNPPIFIFEKVQSAFQQILSQHQNKKILIVSHAGILRLFLNYFDYQQYQSWDIKNCSYLKIAANSEDMQLVELSGIDRVSVQ